MAATIDSRIADANGNIRTECVRKMNGLFETEMESLKAIKSVICFGYNKIASYFYCTLVFGYHLSTGDR